MSSHPPSVDALARVIDDGTLPRRLVIEVARQAIAEWRVDGEGDPEDRARIEMARLRRTAPEPVINATGVLLHTNLGRAPVHPDAAAAAAAAAGGYSALEMDLDTGERGGRGEYVEALLRSLTGGEAALAVGNNAGALLLTVAALAGGRNVVSSRGEQIEIGGSFRLPEIIATAGARSIEVGTTNRTRLRDYARVLDDASLILKVHPSNFRVEGFTEEVSYGALADLARSREVPFVADIGSGLLDERLPWLEGPPPAWLEGEPAARQTLEAGADLVLFSGDKLLGGPQTGIIAGKAALVRRISGHPMARAVRISKEALASLAATLSLYAAGRGGEVPFWAMATIHADELDRRCRAVVATAGVGEVTDDRSLPGAGSAPGRGIPGPVIVVPGDAAEVRARLLASDPPVVGRLDRDRLLIDLRAVDARHDAVVAGALAAACR